MEKLGEYIRWIGELDFSAYPFREADALVLCLLSYFDLSPVFADGAASHSVSDCIPMIEAGEAKLMITGGDMGNGEIFEAAVRSKRYGSMRLTDYEDRIRMDPPLQFSAVTFRSDNFSFIAYRGTDASIPGWKEDCMIAFTKTEAQELALAYAERVIDEGEWIIGGHSKGGNQALYAACLLSDKKWDRVKRVYLLDGPGFCPEVLDVALIDRIEPKTTRIIPEYDVVGKLFEPNISDTRIVKSYRDGILQHSLASWMVEYGNLATVEKNDPGSIWLNTLMNDWIESIPQEDRQVFINELFDAISAEGSESLEELDMDKMQSVLIGLTGLSETTKHTIQKLPHKLLFDETLGDESEQKPEKWAKILSDLRVQSAAMLVAAIAAFFLSSSLPEVVAVGIVAVFAVLQVVLTVRRLIKQRGKLDGMRERFIIMIAMLALLAILIVKEQAMFLFGSMVFGILFLALAYFAIESAKKQTEQPFLKVLGWVEGVLCALYGGGFLLIPQSVVQPVVWSISANLLVDAALRLIYWIRKRRKKAIG